MLGQRTISISEGISQEKYSKKKKQNKKNINRHMEKLIPRWKNNCYYIQLYSHYCALTLRFLIGTFQICLNVKNHKKIKY